MPRLIIIALVAAVAAQAVAVPDQAAAAPVDLERDQHAELYDDKLDEAEPLVAPDHAAGLRAELDLMKEVLEEQKSVIDSLESTAAAEAALAREDPYLGVEATREVEPEVIDERAGGGVEAAAEAAEAGVTDDSLGPLVAKRARGPAAGVFEALARDVADFARLRTSTSEDVVDFVRWGGQGAREADDDDDQLYQDDDVTLTRAKTIAILEDFYSRAQPDKVADAGTIATRYEGFEELLYKRLERQYESVPGGPFKVWRKGPPFPRPELRDALHALGADRYPASPPEAAAEESASLAPRGNGDGEDVLPDDVLLDEIVAAAPELYAPTRRTGPVADDDAPDDDLGGLFVKGLGVGDPGADAVEGDAAAPLLRVPDLEYNAWDDEVERAAQVGYVGPRCTDCVCRSWDGENYGECRPTTDADPCDTIRSYCVKCEADGETPMPGLWTTHARQCERYEGLRDDYAPPARARASDDDDDEDCPLYKGYDGVFTLRCLRRFSAKQATITRLTEDRAARERLRVTSHGWDYAGFDKETCYAIMAAGWCDEAEPASDCHFCFKKKYTVSGKDVYPLLKAHRQTEESLWSRLWTFVDSFWMDFPDDLGDSVWWQGVFIGFFLAAIVFEVGSAAGRAMRRRKKKRAEEPAPDSLAALARQEGYSDLAEKGMSPYVTPRGRGATVRLAAMPMPSPASVSEQDY